MLQLEPFNRSFSVPTQKDAAAGTNVWPAHFFHDFLKRAVDIGLVSWVSWWVEGRFVFYVEIKKTCFRDFQGVIPEFGFNQFSWPLGKIRTPGDWKTSTVKKHVSSIGKSSHLVQVAMDFGHESWFRSKTGPRKRLCDAVHRELCDTTISTLW